jgi:signal transduction histidine kinase
VTRRITAAFLAVLMVVIAAVVVPLGVLETHQLRSDFRTSTRTAAHALAALAEERLDDRHPDPALPGRLAGAAQAGDAVVVLDRAGGVVARAGVDRGTERVRVSAAVGDGKRTVGTVVLSRPTASLERQVRTLWSTLAAAVAIALLLGTGVGWALGRWIGRPLQGLGQAAQSVGGGRTGTRADTGAGPREVREVAAAFNQMADEVVAVLDAQAAMTADVSHQLRTPLAALRLRLDLLADEVGGDTRTEIVGMIAETSRLSRLVDGLLAVARADATVAAPGRVDVSAVCAERAVAWEPIASERGVHLALDEPDRSARCFAAVTPGHLEQILDNVLANALDALPPGGTVRLAVGTDGPADRPARDTTLRIADDGPGMSAELREHAFDRFVTDRRGDGGTGLGLAIVGRLVAADHGTAELSETPGGGLTVELRLPGAR